MGLFDELLNGIFGSIENKDTDRVVLRKLTLEEQKEKDEIDVLINQANELLEQYKDLVEIINARKTLFWKGIEKNVPNKSHLKIKDNFIYIKPEDLDKEYNKNDKIK